MVEEYREKTPQNLSKSKINFLSSWTGALRFSYQLFHKWQVCTASSLWHSQYQKLVTLPAQVTWLPRLLSRNTCIFVAYSLIFPHQKN